MMEMLIWESTNPYGLIVVKVLSKHQNTFLGSVSIFGPSHLQWPHTLEHHFGRWRCWPMLTSGQRWVFPSGANGSYFNSKLPLIELCL